MERRVPTYDKLLWPTLEALRAMGGSGSNQEILDKVIEILKMPEDLQNIPHGDGPNSEIAYRLAWARTYLRLFGALENSSKGVWTVTPKGQALKEQEVARVRALVKKEFPQKRQARLKESEALHETDDESWREKLLSILQGVSPDAFERLAQRLLRESGFVNVEVKGRAGDGGIDGIGVLRIRLLSFQVLFQCKRYKGSVPAKDIRDFRGAMIGRTDKGLFITTGRFTPDARREATRDGAPPIDLVDGEQLCDLLKELKIGVKSEVVEKIEILPDVFKAI
ncbi:restriction endonuclease [Candidatus Binatus soli]|uniref:restriction endonuclease n=1 Tax=Candidatus Binatus soli TaxID=1953413 RepID=UPI003D0E76F5